MASSSPSRLVSFAPPSLLSSGGLFFVSWISSLLLDVNGETCRQAGEWESWCGMVWCLLYMSLIGWMGNVSNS